ncbi:hypothetical protein [Microbulbifer sp. PSTR4-B]|uniref:hypothetical protein n=1 Tax=Microbulbifer sp. PSTR4-B TaxID=3243396 RepID=UPI0040393AAF
MLGSLTSLTGGGGLDMGVGPSTASGGTASTGGSGNRSFTFNNAGGSGGLSTQQMLIGGALVLGALYLWKR